MQHNADFHFNAGPQNWVIAVHGGVRLPDRPLTEGEIATLRAGLVAAVEAGAARLQDGASAADAVEAAVIVLEDRPEFDAGRGSALTSDGRVELDASIMRGADLAAGAVAGVTKVKNPIRAARAVMERTPHVMLQGEGADRFAESAGLDIVARDYFETKHMRELLHEVVQFPVGTVGCVALDRSGRQAAGTSTGGTTGKLPGRVGDSPIIGAGTWSDNRWCSVSGTGQGEFFIRGTVARTIGAMMEFGGYSLANAARETVHVRLSALGGKGGVIALDGSGRVVAMSNTPTLLFAVRTASGVRADTFD